MPKRIASRRIGLNLAKAFKWEVGKRVPQIPESWLKVDFNEEVNCVVFEIDDPKKIDYSILVNLSLNDGAGAWLIFMPNELSGLVDLPKGAEPQVADGGPTDENFGLVYLDACEVHETIDYIVSLARAFAG